VLGWRVRRGDCARPPVGTVLPVMKRAAHILANDLADAQVSAEMAAVCAHDGCAAAFSPIDNRAAIEEVPPDDLAGCNFVGTRDRVPRLMKSARVRASVRIT